MTDAGQSQSARERQLDLVIAEYQRRVESGEPVDRGRLIAQFPHLAGDLRLFFESADKTNPLASGKKTPEISLSDLETLPPGPIADSIAEVGHSPPISHPKSFGRYVVLKVLGRGAMGIVYLAQDSRLERKVALKVPSRDNDEVLRRFHREAKSAANLSHPNICTVYAVDQVDGQPYIAMQYIEGRPLSAYISRDKPMDERKAALVVRKLAQALSHAHERGIVHRDLKPSNVMIGEKHEPVLTDFGLARQVNNTEGVRMTQSGALLGTPGYMSPEQVEGNLETVGSPSDIYSLGVIFYELLTGRLPFNGSVAAVLAQIVSTDPEKPTSLRPQLDRRLETICLRMIAKPIGKRFASMQEVADALSQVLRTPSDRKVTDEDQAVKSTSVRSQQTTVITTGDAQSLLRTAHRCMQSRDYEQAARLLEAIPERFRDPEIDELQEEATARNDEVNFLLAAIEEAEAKQQYKGLLPTVERFLELKPGHRKAFEIYKMLTARGGQTPTAKTSRARSQQKWKLPAVPTSFAWLAAAGVTGILFFFIAKWSIDHYLGQPRQPKNFVQAQFGLESAGTTGASADTKREAAAISSDADVPMELPVKSPPLLLSAPFSQDTVQRPQATLTTAEATIRYVDVDRRVVTVDRNSNLAVYDISRNVEILVGGQSATLDTLRAGMKGTITFDPDHDVITKVSVASTGDASSQPDLANQFEPNSLTAKLVGTKWVNSNNVTFEWTKQGRLLRNGTDRHWKTIDAHRGQITFGPGHVDTLVFNESLTQFRQLINGGPNTYTGRRVLDARASSSSPAGRYRLSATEIGTQRKEPEQIMELKADGTVHSSDGQVGTWSVVDTKLHVVLRGFKVDPATAVGNNFAGTAVKNNGRRFNFELSKLN